MVSNPSFGVVLSTAPFAPMPWWQQLTGNNQVAIDLGEHYQKMSLRNRYYLASATGRQLLSIPLEKGRHQRVPVADVRIAYNEDWQLLHWKTIISLYRRSPYFEYMEHLLLPLYQQKHTFLHEWNQTSMDFVNKFLNLKINWQNLSTYQQQFDAGVADCRFGKDSITADDQKYRPYYQVFSDRVGFLPNCSILDLLFCEGKAAVSWL